MFRIVSAAYLVLVVMMMYDCYVYRREPFWYVVLLVPIWGVGMYIYRFKF